MERRPSELLIVDEGDHGADMPAFLREGLDTCAREVGFNWHAHLTIQEPR